jgi:hypothetical protein
MHCISVITRDSVDDSHLLYLHELYHGHGDIGAQAQCPSPNNVRVGVRFEVNLDSAHEFQPQFFTWFMGLDIICDVSMGVKWADELSDRHGGIHVAPRKLKKVGMVKRCPDFQLARKSLR